MEYEDFLAQLETSIEQKVDKEYEVRFQSIMKNNDVIMHAVVLMKKGEKVSPTIYLNEYYQRYTQGDTIAQLTEEIIDLRNNVQTESTDFKSTEDLSFDKWRDKIILRLVNREGNRQRLKNLPYLSFVDLAVTFHCLVSSKENGTSSFTVTKELMKRWNMTPKKIYTYALLNTPKMFPATIRSMEEVLNDMLPPLEQIEGDKDSSVPCMYILSNESGINGASAILYPEILDNFSQSIHSNLYILPSSIHEVILVPYQKDIQKSQLMQMVEEVNEKEVAKEEVLSSQVYYYDRLTKKIS